MDAWHTPCGSSCVKKLLDECLPGCPGIDAQDSGQPTAGAGCRVVDELSLLFDISYTLESSLELREVIRPVLLKMADRLVHRATEAAGAPPGILVNAAGIHLRKWALDTSDDEMALLTKTHLQAAFALSRAVAGGMVQRQHGSILFIASVAAGLGVPQSAAYAAAKSATLGLMRALAGELSPSGVRVNAIAPGWIDSDATRNWMKTDRTASRRILQRTPMQRLGAGDDVGYAAVYLSSKAARFVTGTVLPVDGGAAIGF